MTKPIPNVQRFMSTTPETIEASATISEAHTKMRKGHMRHLPVLKDGDLVGMISDRDVKLVESVKLADTTLVRVDDVMTTELYTVSPQAPLDEVCGEMAAHKYGSAVIVDNGHVVGIFTTTDACTALRDLLRTRL